MNSWNGVMVCSRPARDDLELSAVVKGGRFKVGGAVCSIPLREGVEDLADSDGGFCRNVPLGVGS